MDDDGAAALVEYLCSREEPVSLHFNDVFLSVRSVGRVGRALRLNCAPVDELYCDVESVGSLGLACLVVALEVFYLPFYTW